MRATVKLLEEKHPGRGREAFGLIAVLSGAGSLGSAGIGDHDNLGIDLTGYESNEAIPAENREKITQLLNGEGLDEDDDEEDPTTSDVSAEDDLTAMAADVAKRFSKDELAELAREAGLDGNAHTNKTELAKAIIASGFQIPDKEGDQ